jgi:DNA-binding NarL/FixJ family response regulator
VKIRLLVIDDSPLARMGLRVLLSEGEAGLSIEVVGEAAGLPGALQLQQSLTPDVILVGAHLAQTDLGEMLSALRWNPAAPQAILLIANQFDEAVRQALSVGAAAGVVLTQSDPRQISAAVRLVASGHLLLPPLHSVHLPVQTTVPEQEVESSRTERLEEHSQRLKLLTPREMDVLELIARGWSNAEVSNALGVGASTVKTHVHRLLDKLGLRNRVQAMIFAYEMGLVGIRPQLARALVKNEPRALPDKPFRDTRDVATAGSPAPVSR